jgi:hypothetical protein
VESIRCSTNYTAQYSAEPPHLAMAAAHVAVAVACLGTRIQASSRWPPHERVPPCSASCLRFGPGSGPGPSILFLPSSGRPGDRGEPRGGGPRVRCYRRAAWIADRGCGIHTCSSGRDLAAAEYALLRGNRLLGNLEPAGRASRGLSQPRPDAGHVVAVRARQHGELVPGRERVEAHGAQVIRAGLVGRVSVSDTRQNHAVDRVEKGGRATVAGRAVPLVDVQPRSAWEQRLERRPGDRDLCPRACIAAVLAAAVHADVDVVAVVGDAQEPASFPPRVFPLQLAQLALGAVDAHVLRSKAIVSCQRL